VQSPEKVVVTFQSIDDLPAAPDGDAAYAVELRGNGVRQEIVFEARDYIELKEVQGVRADYSYTGRVAVEGDDVYTRMRTNASTDSAPGAILRNGDQLDVVDDTVDGWYKARIRTSSDPEAARLQGQIWWIERWLVDHENVPPRPSPTPIPPTPVPAPTARPYVPVPTTPPAPPRPVATPIPTPGLDL
jgi:hypothetical protein